MMKSTKLLCALWLLCLSAVCGSEVSSGRVGGIEFFGTSGVDLQTLRKALPLHSGQDLTADWKSRVADVVLQVTGKPATDVVAICCDASGARTVFIGLQGTNYHPVTYGPAPHGKARLPAVMVRLYDSEEDALKAAVLRGHAEEDDSQGYALAKDSKTRSLQEQIRAYALKHPVLLESVLSNDRDARERRAASDALGYALPSELQVRALFGAIGDADEGVRDEATRALAVIIRLYPEFVRYIEPQRVIDLVSSGTWTDRNKGVFLLIGMTTGSWAPLRDSLRNQALDSLQEMANWNDPGHSFGAQLLLSRLRGGQGSGQLP